MRLKTFRAPTIADALAAVKKDLGRDAVILHTRTTKSGGWLGGWLKIGAKPIVEVIASDDVNVRAPRLRQAPPAAAPAPMNKPPAVAVSPASVAKAYGDTAAATPARTQRPAPAAPPPPAEVATLPVRQRSRPDPAAARERTSRLAIPAPFAPQDATAASSLEAELGAIKRMVGQVLQSASPAQHAGIMPEALFRHYLRLLECQVARDLADQLVGAVRDELTPAELSDESIVRQTVLRRIAEMIPVSPGISTPSRGPDGRPFTIALVGPTGVGKTTTLAKLAATYRLRHGRKVGVITSDTYRIAAVEQLRTYADIIAVPLKVALTPADMAAACQSFADCDVVLIDTAGRSQNDATRLDELRAFIESADPHQTHLVLSSTASEAVLLKTADRFAATCPTHLILTKLDEAVNFGVLLSVARRTNAALSFVTTGQEVPDHIEPGHADRLARLVLDGELAR
ncbi:MAG: flagellar biosynthesis protein FlhF [Phycisphaeraceae bacterium]|nr:flagellar biosynthesis protein FlhF [Phycisphaeraceae bacterium]